MTTTPLAERGIFALLGDASNDVPRRWLVATLATLLVAWLWVVVFLGPYVRSALATSLASVAPRQLLIAVLATALGLIAAATWRAKRGFALMALMLLAYLGGTALSSVGFRLVDTTGATGWMRFSLQRLAYGLLVVAPMAVVWVMGRGAFGAFPEPLGSWTDRSRLFSRTGEVATWKQWMGGLALMAGIPFFLLMQFASGFPISDAVWFVLPAILMSLVNATVEEVIFRGFVQPAVIGNVGVGLGLWAQGLFFGLHHFGLSVSLLGTLPGAVFVGVGSVAFGKSVLETRGLAWAIAAHMVFDIGVFCAFGQRF